MTDYNALVSAAFEAQKRSYSPYSGYRVGAALLAANGKIFTGCNIENAAYPATVCAERTAVFSAVAAGQKSFEAIAIVGGESDSAYPCGVCRQVLNEFCGADFKIIIARSLNDYDVLTLGELLPHSFGPEHLG